MNTEQAFLAEMVANPNDELSRLALMDWYAEQDDPRAELMHIQQQLRKMEVPERMQLESRLRALLYEENVLPVVPTLTNSLGMQFALIPSGEFMMGSPPDEPYRQENETQVAVTHSKAFFMAIHPVTQSQFEKIMGYDPSWCKVPRWKGYMGEVDTSDFALETTSWEMATQYCEKINQLEVENRAEHCYRLPTEAEWEYACRAGTTTAFYFGEEINLQQVNFGIPQQDAEGNRALWHTNKVGTYPPNAFGLFDMHGNSKEWCLDSYQEKLPGGIDPLVLTEENIAKVVRMGFWRTPTNYCRSARRDGYSRLSKGRWGPGFRLVMEKHSNG